MKQESQNLSHLLSEAISFKTVSHLNSADTDFAEFEAFIAWMKSSWPKVFKALRFERINRYGLLFYWKGTTNLPGTIFMAHYDVVPVGNSAEWEAEPFSGLIKDGKIWGRGSQDCKSNLVALMAATNKLLEEGFIPQRDVWLAFGFDEEVGGNQGAAKIAEALLDRKARVRAVFDEGPEVGVGTRYGIEKEIASVAIAEKGSASLKIIIKGQGGHSALPPKSTTLGKLSRFIVKVEDNPHKPKLTPIVKDLFSRLAPYYGEAEHSFANLEFSWQEVLPILEANPYFSAHLRSTIAFTIASAGEAANVLPKEAYAIANLRILPGDSIQGILEYLKELNNEDDLQFELLNGSEPSPASPINTAEWDLFSELIKESFGKVIILPALALGGSDAKWFTPLTDNIFRFNGYRSTAEDKGRIHAINERIGLSQLESLTEFDCKLIRRFSAG